MFQRYCLRYNSRGRNYLKKIRKDVELPIISKVDKKMQQSGTLGLQERVDRIFEQIMGEDQNQSKTNRGKIMLNFHIHKLK